MKAMFIKLKNPQAWLHGLIAAFISGGATALSTDQGLSFAHRMGVDVPLLNLKAMGIVFFFSGLSGAALYLKQSPLPPISTGNTTPPVPIRPPPPRIP